MVGSRGKATAARNFLPTNRQPCRLRAGDYFLQGRSPAGIRPCCFREIQGKRREDRSHPFLESCRNGRKFAPFSWPRPTCFHVFREGKESPHQVALFEDKVFFPYPILRNTSKMASRVREASRSQHGLPHAYPDQFAEASLARDASA